MQKKDKTIALVLGGASPEREVSLMSSKSVRDALISLGYKIKLIDPALGELQFENDDDYFSVKDVKNISSKNYLKTVNSDLFNNVDVVFNGLHGQYGEDGMIQSLFELKGIKYTGSGVLASSISMNKSFTKVMLQHFDVQTPKWFVVNKNLLDVKNISKKINENINYPCVIKPNDQGSAIGLTICKDESELDEALLLALTYSDTALAEQFIDGYEITVGVLDGHPLPVLEIKPKHSFYDYECKYTHGMSEYEVPAKFPADVLETLQSQALLAYNSVGCAHYGRIDFRLSKKLETFCLEVNTLPGLTSTSLLPKTAKAAGISFEELIEKIINASLTK
ncbi:MAG: D-alanine--D-alanine ligase [Bacteroidetes bacterium]|nr:D-alanine--D-alanine ligase [Bacteroidota bacterium]